MTVVGREASAEPALGPLVVPSTVVGWALRAYGRQYLWSAGLECRLRTCGLRITPREKGVTVFARPDRAYGRVGGTCACGQSMLCGVCAPRLASFRAAEVSLCFERVITRTADARLAKRADALSAIAERERAAREPAALIGPRLPERARAVTLAAQYAAHRDAHAENVAASPFLVDPARPAPVAMTDETLERLLDAEDRRTEKWAGWAVGRAAKFGEAAEWEAHLLTYTIPHSVGTDLGVELDVFRDAWRQFRSGKGAAALNRGVLGSHVAREITLGAHGWHYHHHVCMYVRPGYPFAALRGRWLSAIEHVGRWRDGAEEHAFDVSQIVDAAGARYVAKISGAVDAATRAVDAASRAAGAGMELAGGAMKVGRRGSRVGRNLMALLHDAAFAGDGYAREKWIEACAAITTRKISSVRWSPGLRDLVGIAAKSDEAVAAEEVTSADVLLGALAAEQWTVVCRAHAELALCIAANQGRDQVNNLLANIDAGQLHDAAEVAAL